MKVTQIYNILNDLANDILGKPNYLGSDGNVYPDTSARTDSSGTAITYGSPSYLLQNDLSNVVDIGKLILGATEVDNYVNKLINHIGRVVFVNRLYNPVVPSLLMESWEYGSIMEKIDADMPETTINYNWELEDGKTYNQDIFTAPKGVRAKFFNNAVTFEIDMSYSEETVRESFSSASQLNSFFSMIETKIKNSMSVNYANLTRSTIANMIAGTVYDSAKSLYNSTTKKYTFSENSYVKCINVLGLYKSENPDNLTEAQLTALTPQTCLKNQKFIQFAALQFMLVSDRMADMSTLFNVGGKERFTPKKLQHIIMLSEFEKSANVYLQSDTFHNELTKLPAAETVNFWQGTGNDYSFANTSKIHTISNVMDGNNVTKLESEVSGIIGVIFDRDAMGINNKYNKVDSHYNKRGGFINNFYKSFARYYNDFDENCVVFIVAE